MVKLNICNLDDSKISLIKELADEFSFNVSNKGNKVFFNKNNKFQIKYKDNQFEVNYYKDNQIYLAIFNIVTMLNNNKCKNINFAEKVSNLTYMLDCSRNAVPYVSTIKKLIRHLAFMGYDEMMLYTEDTYKVDKYPYFGYLRTPFTKENIKELDAYASSFGIELVPCIQTLAHLNCLTRHYAMQDLFDCNDILLTKDEKTYEFIEELIKTCRENFSSKKIHVGMDEAWMLGRGKFIDKYGYQNKFDIMHDHLDKVIEICKKYDFHPMMWSDMFFGMVLNYAGESGELPSNIKELVPQGIDLCYWDYYHTKKEYFAKMLDYHLLLDNNIAFAGGAWRWLGFTPDNRYSLVEISASMEACIEKNINDYILTGWGDNGAECSCFGILPSLLMASCNKYNNLKVNKYYKDLFATLAGVSYSKFMRIDLANRITNNNDIDERNTDNKYLLFNDVLLGTLDTTIGPNVDVFYRKHVNELKPLIQNNKWDYIFKTQYDLCRVLSLKAELGIRLRKYYKENNKKELRKCLADLKNVYVLINDFYISFKNQWYKENHQNGFDVQDIRIGALKQRIVVAIEKVNEYLKHGTKVEELEEELLDHMGHGKDFEIDNDQCEYRWRRMTSVNVND